MADDDATPDEAPAPPSPEEVIATQAGVAAEYAEPEDDESDDGGDLVQLVRTGWLRLMIAGHGRVRFRPPRFGELRHIMVAFEEMVDEVTDRAHANQATADAMNAEIRALEPDPVPVGWTPPSSEEKHALLADVQKRSRKANREFTSWRDDQYLAWWRLVHEGDGERFRGLGVSGEQLPDLDALPVWLTSPQLAQAVLAHWQAVPLDRGRR